MDYIELLEKSPYVGIVVMLVGAITVLWKAIKRKDNKITSLAEDVIRATTEFDNSMDRSEERTRELKVQNEQHRTDHEKIVELLKDVLRKLK